MSESELSPTSPKPFVFVLMPFDPKFDDLYKYGIKGAADDAGAYAERVDEQIFVEGMMERVFNQINKADVIVADMTGRNPNVFYEVGYAHALNKIVLLLTQNTDDIPFDLKHRPHIVYGGSIAELRPELSRRIEWGISQLERSSHDQDKNRISLTINDINIHEAGVEDEIPTVPFRVEEPRCALRIYVRNEGKTIYPSIRPIYLFTEDNSILTPFVARTISSSLFGAWREADDFTQEVESIKADVNDSLDGLTKQYFLNESLNEIAVGAVERLEIPFRCRELPASRFVRLRLRLLTGYEYYDYPFNVKIN
jgi:hypothetical protein